MKPTSRQALVDLFTSRLNYKFTTYATYQPTPWVNLTLNAFPPFLYNSEKC